MTQLTQPDGAPPGQPWAVTGSLVWAVAVSLVLLSVGALARPTRVVLAGQAPHPGRQGQRRHGPAPRQDDDGVRRLLTDRPGGQATTTDALVLHPEQLLGPGADRSCRHLDLPVHVPLHREIEVTARSVRTGPQQLF